MLVTSQNISFDLSTLSLFGLSQFAILSREVLKKKCRTLSILTVNTQLFQNHLLITKYIYTAHQYWGKLSKILHTFCLYLQLPAIMNLIFHTKN